MDNTNIENNVIRNITCNQQKAKLAKHNICTERYNN